MPARTIALLIAAAGILSGCGRTVRRFRIVSLTDLSGPQAAVGDGIRQAAALALAEQQAELENAGWRIELTAYDANTSTQEFSLAVSRVAAQPDVACAVVHTGTAGNLSAQQALQTAGIPAVFPLESAPLPDGDASANSLWLSPDDRNHGFNDAAWTAAHAYQDVFLLLDDGEHARRIGESYLQRAEALALRVTPFRQHPDQASSAWVSSFKALSPQLVYFSGSSGSAESILAELEDEGFTGAFFFAESEAEDRIPVPFSSEGILLVFSGAAAHSENFSRPVSFSEKYRTVYGTDPPPLSELGFDAAALCLRPLWAERTFEPERTSPRTVILSDWQSGRSWEGVGGTYPSTGGRPCRAEIFFSSKDTDFAWISAEPAASPISPSGGC